MHWSSWEKCFWEVYPPHIPCIRVLTILVASAECIPGPFLLYQGSQILFLLFLLEPSCSERLLLWLHDPILAGI